MRLRWSLLAALAVHVALWTWAARLPAPDPGGKGVPTERAPEVDVEMVEAPRGDEPSTSVDHAPSVPAEHHLARTRAPPVAGIRSVEPPGPFAGPGEAAGSWTFSPSGTESKTPGPLAGTALNEAVRAGVRRTLDEERSSRAPNRAVIFDFGLAPGAALATISEDLVRRSRVPTEGCARLQFDSDASGAVTAVRVLDVSAGWPEWEEVAAQIVRQARGKPMRVPAGARGLSVTIEVTSAMRTVDGGKPAHGAAAAVAGVVGAIVDPVDTAIGLAAREPLVHVVKARVVDVEAF